MKPFYLLLFALFCYLPSTNAQRNCGSMDYLEQQLNTDPKRPGNMEAIDLATKVFSADPSRAVDGIITIPVVMHIVWNSAVQNISEAQIQSQINILTDDFRRLNSDADGTWSQATDTEIEFCLATVDPSGNPTSGITRTNTSVSSFGSNDNVKFNSSGGKDAWPATDYLNFWVCNLSGGLLGYAQFPGGAANTDGVVCSYKYVGNTGTAQAPFDGGRTATHEVGHWLNLRHIWGDGGCGVDDFISDTPTSDASNGGCSVGHVSCGSVDMVQNYMDYSDDACMNLFTEGQKTRMRALFDTGGFRASLLNSAGCGSSGPTCSDGVQNGNETGVDCGGPDCQPCASCTGTEVALSITLDNYPEETSWILADANGSTVASGGTYGNSPDGSTITDNFCLPNGCYDFIINDTYGDGICCSEGNGSYSLTDNSGNVLAAGGQFTSTETTNFCVGSAPPVTGCTDASAHNYNPNATQDDGSCETCSDSVMNGDETGTDCGGSLCAPCNSGCNGTVVDLTIVLDNYPEETSWVLTNANGSTVASGGTYGNSPDGSTITDDFCLANGCYDFTINDTYGDGICCAEGNGSYSVTDGNGNVLANGGQFATTETTNFCLGSTPPVTGCTNSNAHNYNSNATQDDGSCETCSDNVINGDETGVDCGGSLCAPCSSECSYGSVNFNDFDSSWGLWNDGGTDCLRSASFSQYAYSAPYCVRLRDNSGVGSSMTTDNLNLNAYEELTIDFTYYPVSMENNEDFWLQISTNGGSSYTTIQTWARGTDFSNNNRYFETVVIEGPFSSNTKLRFRCDASANGDRIYMDDVDVTGCSSGNSRIITNNDITTVSVDEIIAINNLYPNPAQDRVNVEIQSLEETNTRIEVYNLAGKLVHATEVNLTIGQQTETLDLSAFDSGLYFMHFTTADQRIVKKFVVTK